MNFCFDDRKKESHQIKDRPIFFGGYPDPPQMAMASDGQRRKISLSYD